ncbi:MAG: hypothetical protein EPN91_05595 [Salinibacterium sp.]|nr:MAG: hypothetical protein EPN91_05595 [Salinibacterium sp.]
MTEDVGFEDVTAEIARLPAGRLADTAVVYHGDDGTICVLVSCGCCSEPVAILSMMPGPMRELAADIIEHCNERAS